MTAICDHVETAPGIWTCPTCKHVAKTSRKPLNRACGVAPKRPPGLFRKAANLGRAAIDAAKDGFTLASPELIAARVAVCKSCDWYDAKQNTCLECGCALKYKPQMRAWECRLGKWPKEAPSKLDPSDPVHKQQRQLATDFIATIPEYPPERFRGGAGVVIVGGGPYAVSAEVTIRVLRHVGCTLPIELWHFPGEIPDAMRARIEPLDVTRRVPSPSGFKWLNDRRKGWQLKPYAILNSSFSEVLYLDADCYPIRNPEFLFDLPQYVETGAIIWPDINRSLNLYSSNVPAIFGVDYIPGMPAESGQLVIDKRRCWRELNLACHYNDQAEYSYQIVYGDKDLFPLAWQRLGTRYARLRPNAVDIPAGIIQLDHAGQPLFLHRTNDKWRLESTRFTATTQDRSRETKRNLPLDDFCLSVLEELKE